MKKNIEIIEKRDVSHERIRSFDFFRAYGCLAIIMLHVVSAWKDDPANSAGFYSADFVRMLFDNAIVPLFVRAAVPIFFMMSGALFLDPKRDVGWKKIKKHIKKILIVLGSFGYLMAIVELMAGSRSFQINYLWIAILNLLQEKSWSHLWYLYATIGLYLLTPILRAWIQKANDREIRILIGIVVILLSVIPTANNMFGIRITTFGIATSGGSILCFILGYYLYRKIIIKKKWIYTGLVVGGVMTVVVSLLCRNWNKSIVEPFHIWIVIYASSLFALLADNKFIERIGNHKFIIMISKLSLIIYIIHPILINLFYKGFHIYPDILPSIIGELVFWAVVSVCSIGASWLIKHITILRKNI